MNELTAPEAFTIALELAKTARSLIVVKKMTASALQNQIESAERQIIKAKVNLELWELHRDKLAADLAEMQSECRCGRPMNALADMCLDCEAKFTTDGEWEWPQ